MKVPADRAERSEVFILKGLLDIGGLIAEEAEGGGHPLQQQGGKPGERERHYHGDGIEDWQGEAKIERHADEQQPGRYAGLGDLLGGLGRGGGCRAVHGEAQQKQIEDADAAAQGGSVQDGVIQFAQQAENADHGAAADQHTERQKQGMQGLFFLRFYGDPSLSGIIWRGLFHGQGLFHGCAWN